MEDVVSATDNFASNKLIGRGGFGLVYKGELSLPEGRILVAFKRLDRNLGQGNTEFWKEIMMLSKYKHENLISLIHFCILGDERILVYDYASRGSLDRYLSDANLTWIQRLNICLGVARALRYLHDPMATQQRLLHRDIKSSNILLDDKWNAKVSDFGLSKIGLANLPQTYQVSNAVGTPGYCDPLYYETGLVSKESDVYSFGVVLFEVLCGKLCCEYRNDKLVCILVPTWKKCFAEKRMDDIICRDLKDQINQDSLMTFSTIANQCLDRDHKKRPTMIQIVKKLEIALAQCGAINTNGVLKRRKSSVLPAQSFLDHKISALHKHVTTKLIMSLKRRRFEGEESTDDHEPERKITSTHAGVSALVRGAKVMIIQTLQRLMAPIIVPIFTPMIHRVITEQIGSAKQDILASMKENLTNKGSTPVPNKLRLQFRNKISQPVFSGETLFGENWTIIQIDLVNSLNGQIVNTGPASMAKLEVVGFRLGDNEKNDDSWTFEDFQKQIMIEKNGKRTLQGITSLQLKEGTCFVDNCSFTRYLENTNEGWYRLGVGVVDAVLANVVDVATTEAFQMEDWHALYSEEHPHPCLSDKVCHLRHVHYEGTRYKLLEEAGVVTVKDLLILLYTNPKRLEDILQLKASSNIWDDVVKNAQASNGMFLYLDPSIKQQPGVVLNAKLQLKALIVEPHQYIPVNQLSAEQKVDNQDLVKFASKKLEMLLSFEDETCLIEYLQSLPSANQSGRTPNIIDVKIIGWDAMIRMQFSKKYHPVACLTTALKELDLEVHHASISIVNELIVQQATVKMGSRLYTQDQLRLALTNRFFGPYMS